jgi:uncharacterized protein YkwD
MLCFKLITNLAHLFCHVKHPSTVVQSSLSLLQAFAKMKNMKTKTLLLLILMLLFNFPLQAQDAVGDLLGRINTLRTGLGLAPYTLHPALTAAAQSHGQWMAATGQVTHVQDDGSNPASRAAAAGYVSQWVSENIYMGGLAAVDSAWNFWTNSSVHYAGLTSINYQHIGIAAVPGEHGTAFVLVFGVPAGAVTTTANTAGTGAIGANADAPAAPPSYVVGVDAVGNIMHELQQGQTLGDVLLTYGYTWDDLPALMALNELTDEDIRYLEIGEVLLVPPKSGTYTPTAPFESSAEATEPANPEITVTSADGILPTPLANEILPTPLEPSPVSRIEATTENGLVMPATFVAPQTSPTAFPTLTLAPSATPFQAMMVSTLPVATTTMDRAVNTVQNAPPANSNRRPLWLIGAIAVQVGILGLATVEYFRRRK